MQNLKNLNQLLVKIKVVLHLSEFQPNLEGLSRDLIKGFVMLDLVWVTIGNRLRIFIILPSKKRQTRIN